ncbi:hypothetical protein M0R45_031937 [Rubus argutus]|uniref:Uncharacterized protein n=1 Tax=Rubus argutus TaxID=59490 RepID=A0AAW1WF53_RUBAR
MAGAEGSTAAWIGGCGRRPEEAATWSDGTAQLGSSASAEAEELEIEHGLGVICGSGYGGGSNVCFGLKRRRRGSLEAQQ